MNVYTHYKIVFF